VKGNPAESAVPHLLHVFPSFEVGGAQLRTARLVAAFGPRLRHSVLALDGRREAAVFLPAEARVELLDAPSRRGSLGGTLALWRLLRALGPDLVCTYNWGSIDGALAARLAGVPFVHHEDGFGRDELQRPLRRRSAWRRMVLAGAGAVVVPSSRLEGVARSHWGVTDGRLALIPNGIDLARYTPADGRPELRAALGIPADAPVVGSLGGLRPEKNFGRLVDVHAALPEALGAHLVIVGDGAERDALERRAQSAPSGARVHFVGLQPDPIPYLRMLDAFALTSDTEQMPLALVEAMACGLPAIASDVGDTRLVLPPEQLGQVVALDAPDAVQQLAARLTGLFEDPQERRELGRANRHRAEERFALATMAERYRALYQRALGPGKPIATGVD
jgi:glycosyltransferase involved in cell wall biosynthesis